MCLIALHRPRRVAPASVTLPALEPPRVPPSGLCRRPGAYSGRRKSRGLPVVSGAGRGRGQGAECLPAGRKTLRSYDPGVSDRKIRVTVTLEPHLAAYAERLVEAGKAPVRVGRGQRRADREGRARQAYREAVEGAHRPGGHGPGGA